MISKAKIVVIAIPTSGSDGRQRLAGIYRYLGENQYWDVRLYRSRIEFTESLIQDLVADGADGFIFAMPYSGKTFSALMATGLPVVVMTDAEKIETSSPLLRCFFVDNIAIGKAAAQFFHNLGRFESFAYIPDTYGSNWSREREQSFFAATRDKINCFAFHHVVDNPACRRWPQDRLGEFLQTLPKPVAVFAANDNYAVQAIAAARSAGIAIPSQVSVLGVDNDELLTEGVPLSLSSIEPDFNEAGYRAAEALGRMMDKSKRKRSGRQSSKSNLYGIKNIVARQSTGFLAPSSLLVSNAERLIKNESAILSGPNDVAKRLHVSRSLLDLRFREIRGHSVGEAIRTAKLQNVRSLLATTHKSILSIGAVCGFANHNYLKSLFKKQHGVSMREWRNLNNKKSLVPNADKRPEST